MYKILVSNNRKKYYPPVEFTLKDYAIASVALNEDVRALRSFSKKCFSITDEVYAGLMVKPALNITRNFIQVDDKSFLIFYPAIDWRVLIIAYAIYNSSDAEETLKDVLPYIESRTLDMVAYLEKLKRFREDIAVFKRNFYKGLEYFNINKLIDAFQEVGVNAELHKNKVIVTLEDIKVGNQAEGYLTYNSIILFIRRFTVDGFILRFDNFDFNSYWKIPVILHPYLSTPYGFNNCLEFLPSQNYKIFVEALLSITQSYEVLGGYKSMSEILQDFQDLRILWNENKYSIEDRIELSKYILNQKKEL